MSDISNISLMALESYGQPPEPSKDNPYAQIIWLFDKRGSRSNTKETKSTYIAARNRIVLYLKHHHGNSPFILKTHIDEFFLVRLKRTLELYKNVAICEPQLKSHSLAGFLSAVRQVLQDALSKDLLSCGSIQNASLGSSQRETDAHKDYSDKELDQILTAINSEMRLVLKILAGYKSLELGVGRDPRIKSNDNPNAQKFEHGFGWKVEENLQWYFENVMGAIPSFASQSVNNKLHNKFYYYASTYHGGINNVYKRWGVIPFVGRDLIMPSVINLIYLTGMNPTSLLELKVDSYKDEHPLTNMPYITFEKRRSGGEKELHLSLLDSNGEQPLKRKQAINVKRAFDTLLALTKKMRDALEDNSAAKKMLVIYQSGSRTKYGEVISLSSAQTSGWCRSIVKKYDLKNDDGMNLDFNLVRFRSTKLTSMALEGRDLFEIQQVARHQNINTTLSYINRNKIDNTVRSEVLRALQQIRENRFEHANSCSTNSLNPNELKPVKIYKGLISNCKNTFDPPEWVKRSKDYVPGSACIRFNMCLFCKNIIVMREHLPALAAYRSQLMSVQQNNIQNLPNAEHYDKSLELLNELFDSDKSEFSSEDLEWAIEVSENLDFIVDPLIYHGVAE